MDAALYSRMRDAYRALAHTAGGLSAFRDLLDHQSVHVRLWVAAQLLAAGDAAAKPALEAIATSSGLTAMAAQTTLSEFANGTLQPPFGQAGTPNDSIRDDRAAENQRYEAGLALQIEVCHRFDVRHCPASVDAKAGVALSTIDQLPLNALRHVPTADSSGWYIWGGTELSQHKDFFQPLHVRHLADVSPGFLPYLGLPPGWRVLIAPDYEDVWFDADIVHV